MEEESLESRINRATNPLNKELDLDSVQTFCEQLNRELEGPQLATRLLAHKIQSPQEWEAVQALTVLETCMKNCGKRFHNEVGKFRFLNELIKVVSPKYLGGRSPEKVKSKILELMYSWTLGLPDEAKIAEAYQMLKKQGILKEDPVLQEDVLIPPPPPPRPRNVIFDDEEKSKMLARLLKSTHPEDLRAANKLIKEMVQEDQKRMEKISKRVNAIEEVNNNVSLLTDMLSTYTKGETSEGNEDLMKELYQRCEKMRPTLFRLASDTEDNDDALAEILQANDSLTHVINTYRQMVRGEEINGETSGTTIPGSSSALLDLSGLDLPTGASTYPSFPALSLEHTTPPLELGVSASLLDDELMSLGLSDSATCSQTTTDTGGWNSFQSSDSIELPAPVAPVIPPRLPTIHAEPSTASPAPSRTAAMEDLDLLGKTLLQQSLPPDSLHVRWDKQQSRPTLRDLQNKTPSNVPPNAAIAAPPLHYSASPVHNSTMTFSGQSMLSNSLPLLRTEPSETAVPTPGTTQGETSLANVMVPLESIKPSSILPVTVYDRNNFRVLFHFAQDSPPERLDVLVVVISMISTAPLPVKNIVFQAAVPKVMKVKLQPPSGTELPAFSPLVPPSAITQVLLLSNPQKESVRLRYRLTFSMGDQTFNEMGDVEQFPPPQSWGAL
ncbi:ADP-ribosylation factor-binding protein GGA1 [Ambystoma mexicanum]|uniref:ADP-ribosylation factor-binding protein GGA1 n=1 Tax=Ambystoma mexicanum TaxID=8296 RepID=UPI0037E8D4C0